MWWCQETPVQNIKISKYQNIKISKYQNIKISKYQNIYDRELTIARLVPQFVNRDSAETLHSMPRHYILWIFESLINYT